jgi:hypothetical protein
MELAKQHDAKRLGRGCCIMKLTEVLIREINFQLTDKIKAQALAEDLAINQGA